MLPKLDFMHLVALGSAVILATGMPALAQSPNPQTDHVKSCEFCHGAGGDSNYDLIPRLNGQRMDYLLARMAEFGAITPDTARGINTMSHAANVDPSLRAEIAGYFARQPPTAPRHGGANWMLGEQIYRNGIAAEKITSCQSCHGPEGEGKGAAPRLAGQHASYLKTRLWLLTRFDLPGNHEMHRGTADLSGTQMDAVVSYLAGD